MGLPSNAMTDRLRRLDVLFADKVLGKRFPVMIHEGEPCAICGTDLHSTPPYTRSLDAAWEGATSKFKFVQVGDTHGEPYGCCAIVLVDRLAASGFYDGIFAPHPAEALVLACLRAVGCTEEELP